MPARGAMLQRVWETGHARSVSFAEIEATHVFLRRQLNQATLSNEATESPDRPAHFTGTADRVRFTATMSAHVGIGGLYGFELAPVTRENSTSLELAWQLYRPDRSEWFEDDPSRRVLIEGIEAVRLQYYGALEAEEDPNWYDAWDSQTALPMLIKLQLDFPSDDGRAWPELTVAPLAATTPPS